LATVAAERAKRPLAVVDIAVPPDVQPRSAAESSGTAPLRIIDLEDVGAYQKEVEARRCESAAAGEAIVNAQVVAFGEWLRNQILGPKMERLRAESERCLARELERTTGGLSAAESERLASFGSTLIKRFLGAYRRVEEEE
jgi:glutamyl-tRNA reductase